MPSHNAIALGKQLANTKPQAWLPIYATVAGKLPLWEAATILADAAKPTALDSQPQNSPPPAAIILQGEINVTVAGTLELSVEAPAGATAWVDATPFEGDALEKITADLTHGRHRVTLQVPSAKPFNREAAVRVQCDKPKGSPVQFEPVGGP